jgi:hypothetical protein
VRAASVALIVLCAALPARAAASACSVTVDVTDTDPKGLNVRATPGGRVVATLVDKADWIELHVVGQSGDWFAVDRAVQIDNNRMGENIVMWHGHGYVHKSTIGLSGMQQGGTIFADHDLRSRIVVKNAHGDQPTQLLGCWNDFYRVRARDGTGWTKEVCTNENTTCS